MTPLWTICILSIKTRQAFLSEMLGRLVPQLTGEVQLIVDIDDGAESIGTKRNRIMRAAAGEYVSFLDDDDAVNEVYVGAILDKMKSHPEADWFATSVLYSQDGVAPHPNNYPFPAHIGPVRTSIARAAGFPDVDGGDDFEYGARLRRMGNIREGVRVDAAVYHYRFRRDRSGERTHSGMFGATSWQKPSLSDR